MARSCDCCNLTIEGKAYIIKGEAAKWFSGKDKNLLCKSCAKNFELQAIQNNVGAMDRGKFIWIYYPKLFKQLRKKCVPTKIRKV